MGFLITLFIIGFIEDAIGTFNVRATAQGRPLLGACATFAAQMLWFFVLRLYIERINHVELALAYSCGSALGAFLLIKFVLSRQKSRRYSKRTRFYV